MNPDVITSYTCPLCGTPYADGEEAKECLARCRKRQAARKALAPEATAHEMLSEEIALGLERVLGEFRQSLEAVVELEALQRKQFLTEREVERLFGVSVATLRTKRCRGDGPEYIKDGAKVFYTPKAVRHYLEGRRVRTRESR